MRHVEYKYRNSRGIPPLSSVSLVILVGTSTFVVLANIKRYVTYQGLHEKFLNILRSLYFRQSLCHAIGLTDY